MTRNATSDVSFRVASALDAPCIGVLATQVFLDTYATDGIRPALAHEVLEHLSTDAISALLSCPATTFILAELSGHLVGFVQLTKGSNQELVVPGGGCELNRLYVQARFSGKGIGKALLHHAEDFAATQGAETLWLTAWVGNHRALAFYQRQGYRDVGATMYIFQEEKHENRVFTRTLNARTAT